MGQAAVELPDATNDTCRCIQNALKWRSTTAKWSETVLGSSPEDMGTWVALISISVALAGTHCNYPWRDSQAELSQVACYMSSQV